MNEQIRSMHNFTIQQSYIPKSCYFGNFLTSYVYRTAVGLEAILINDIVGTFKFDMLHMIEILIFMSEIMRLKKHGIGPKIP